MKAREWFEKAAASGNDYGMNSLGWFYQNGLGVAVDYGKAREWYEKAGGDKQQVCALQPRLSARSREGRNCGVPTSSKTGVSGRAS